MPKPIFARFLCAFSLLFILTAGPVAAEDDKAFHWPGSARAAVCLTYDDAIDQHLDIAAPDLESAGLRGTFYIQGASTSLAARIDDWRALAARGHELGNHSLYHPCIRTHADGSFYDWVLPEYDMGQYTVNQIIQELRVCNTLLQAVDGRTQRTYGAPCGDLEAGGVSYMDSLPALFHAVRSGGPAIPDNMRNVELYFMPVQSATGKNAQQLIKIVEDAAARGTLAVICFHGVGGGHNLNTPREEHRVLIEHLNAHRDRFWTDTFLNVTNHIRAERQRLGWD